MKKPISSRSGFTLMELITAMVIMTLLATLTIGVVKGVKHRASVSRAQGEISVMETAIESYKIDNGIYPETNSGANDLASPKSNYDANIGSKSGGLEKYKDSSRLLFSALSGKKNYKDSSLSENGVMYMQFKKTQVRDLEENSFVVDPFRNPYGYYTNSEIEDTSSLMYNVGTFDLWSTMNKTPASEDGNIKKATAQWVSNWKN